MLVKNEKQEDLLENKVSSKKKNYLSHKKGKVYLVGAGPGDPTLITVKGMNLLTRAEVVVYDYLASSKLLAYAPQNAQLIYVGKRGGVKHTYTQGAINRMLVDHAQAGRIVIRLKGGDPFIFGRGGEELCELVKGGVDFEVVPGVTSATAAATYAGIPITHRHYTSSVAFVTGHEDPTKANSSIAWDKLATGVGTLVFYMGIKNLPLITKKLIHYGRDPKTMVAVVRWASTPQQRSVVGSLDKIADMVQKAKLKPPALVVIGDVVTLRDKINWFEKRPLFGKKILITRSREQASKLTLSLEDKGAECLEFATINIKPPDSWDELDQELGQIAAYDWLLFTSINGVKFFFNRLFENKLDARLLHGVKIGVVGSATAEILKVYGITADLLPAEFTGKGLADALVKQGVTNKKILIPRALEAKEVLPETLRAACALVKIVAVYQNIRPQNQTEALRRTFTENKIDLLTFTSSSTVTNFLYMLNVKNDHELHTILRDVKIAAIGPITAETIRNNNLSVHIQSETYTIPALVDTICDYYENL